MSSSRKVLGGRDNGDWRARAACRNVDPDLFFPLGRTGPVLDHIEAAKAVCRACPVRSECLDFAMATHQDDGIWGGTSEDERRRLRPTWRARQSAASSGPAGTTGGAALRGIVGSRR